MYLYDVYQCLSRIQPAIIACLHVLLCIHYPSHNNAYAVGVYDSDDIGSASASGRLVFTLLESCL